MRATSQIQHDRMSNLKISPNADAHAIAQGQTDGNEIPDFNFIFKEDMSVKPLFKIREKGKYGFMDADGEIVIEPQYPSA